MVCDDIGITFMSSIGIVAVGLCILWFLWKLMDLAWFLSKVKALMDNGLEEKINKLEYIIEKEKRR